MKVFNQLFFFALPLSILLPATKSCNQKGGAAEEDRYISSYKPSHEVLYPAYALFHKTPVLTELHFKINSKELLYTQQKNNQSARASISIHYNLLSGYPAKDRVDSATIYMNDDYADKPKELIGVVDLKATYPNHYLLEIILRDLNRNVLSKSYLRIEKKDTTSRQNFLLLSRQHNAPLFRDYLLKNETVRIQYQSAPGTPFYVRYYNRDFPLALPPFSTEASEKFEYKADSTFVLQRTPHDTAEFTFSKQGFYHIQTDTTIVNGLSIFKYNDDFPYLKQFQDLIQPLRYLTAESEYAGLVKNKNPKKAVDEFWLRAAGSNNRARDLIKKFYNRVQHANNYFSCHTEGWKTDRGMMYIVYGAPDVVYHSSSSESWIYGEEKSYNAINFTFMKVINPFTNNDYRLERSYLHRSDWESAVDAWRQGKIYTEE
jgi:GWxTD domain-containing protein